jgi:hypothetical protein
MLSNVCNHRIQRAVLRCTALITVLARSHAAAEMVHVPAAEVSTSVDITVDGKGVDTDAAVPPTTANTPCITDSNCSYNGACVNEICVCDAAWEGAQCGTLRLLPTARVSGLRAVDDGHNTSTWGGTVSK